jgi:sulfur carrier protein
VSSPAPAPHAATLVVHVNGQPHELPAGATVAALLATLSPPPKGPCAVEVNREIVPRSQHDARTLADGDRVEIVTFVGGG